MTTTPQLTKVTYTWIHRNRVRTESITGYVTVLQQLGQEQFISISDADGRELMQLVTDARTKFKAV